MTTKNTAINQQSTPNNKTTIRAHWIGENAECSHCHKLLSDIFDADSSFSLSLDNTFTPFCPWCGAKMDEKTNNN